ncbi:Alpha/Beta hydrolase protein [Aspergillus unguis]
MTQTDNPAPVSLPNSEQFYLTNAAGEQYLIQVSWPLHWKGHEPDSERKNVPVIYIVDGNALFLTATEASWRRSADSHYQGGGIVVAIGYPLEGTSKVYHRIRRGFDMTVPTPEKPVEGGGGADLFLDFIADRVKPEIRRRFPSVNVDREALYGHSYGGLFALHALFTRPRVFDAYIASSPSIWWNERCVLEEARRFLEAIEEDKVKDVPALMLYVGGLEQDPRRWRDEPDESWNGRKRDAEIFNMRKNLLELMELTRGCRRLNCGGFVEYTGEDHGTVMACSMSRGLATFFEDWPLE